MSRYSGVCDLFDHISMEKMHDMGTYYASDELECFKIFKERTKGVIYQNRYITVSEYNQDYVKSKARGHFDFIEHVDEIDDNRCKNNKRTIKYFTYIYWDKEYKTLKELNKHGVFIVEEIHFDMLLDIIPYYPYTISFSCSDADQEIIYINTKPSYIADYESQLKNGSQAIYPERFIQELARHFRDVVQKYYDYKLDERVRKLDLSEYEFYSDDYYQISLSSYADELHEIKFIWEDGKVKPYWSNPILKDHKTILISREDIDYFLKEDIANNQVYIEYIEECVLPISIK